MNTRPALACLALALIALAPPARAGAPAYYHPDDVAAKSARFAASAQSAGEAFDRAQLEVGRLGAALQNLETGVALLGQDAPEPLRAWADSARKDGLAQFLVARHFVNQVQEDYVGAFEAALKRALSASARGEGVTVCRASSPMLGPGGRSGRACEGEDMNAALAALIDKDPALAEALAEITTRTWPAVTLPSSSQTLVPLTGTTRQISAAKLADAFLADRLQARLEVLEDAQSELDERIEAGEASALAEAERLKAAYLQGVAEDGLALRTAAASALQRAAKKGDAPAEVGLCANPPALGGCPGDDVTEEALDALLADKKLLRALEKQFRSRSIDQ